MRLLKLLTVLILFSVVAPKAAAIDERSPTILTYGESPLVGQFIDSLAVSLDSEIRSVVDLEQVTPKKNRKGLYIILGVRALREFLAQEIDSPAIVVYATRIAYNHAIKAHKHSLMAEGKTPNVSNITAVYSDPDPELQLRLIKQFYPNGTTVSVMLSDFSAFIKPELHSAALKAGVSLRTFTHNPGDNINQAINETQGSHAILALPDNQIWNGATMKNIFLSTYRQKRPIFGWNRNMIKVGSLATAYFEISDTAAQTAELIREIINNKKVPPATYSKFYNVAINEDVARSFGKELKQDNLLIALNKPQEKKQ